MGKKLTAAWAAQVRDVARIASVQLTAALYGVSADDVRQAIEKPAVKMPAGLGIKTK